MALTRWKASWECWKVRSMYLRMDKAAPRTMGYRSLEKTCRKSPLSGAPQAWANPSVTTGLRGIRDPRVEAADPCQSKNRGGTRWVDRQTVNWTAR